MAAVSIAGLLLAVSGCGDDTDPVDPAPGESSPPPGQTATTWQPQAPSQPVDPGAVERDYTDVLDAAVAASGDELAWGAAQVSTEDFNGVCAVTLERVGQGAFSPDADALKQALATAIGGFDFPDLDFQNDPGGALTFVAHDSHDALFEFRSKGQTTVAVRVATAESECSS